VIEVPTFTVMLAGSNAKLLMLTAAADEPAGAAAGLCGVAVAAGALVACPALQLTRNRLIATNSANADNGLFIGLL